MNSPAKRRISELTEPEEYDVLFKVVVIGDSTVGKTSLLQRFKSGSFSEKHSCTIGVDFIVKTVEIDDKVVKLHIWDTAGQERFKSVSHSFYHSAHAAVLVYDITSEESFITLTRWLSDVRRYARGKTTCFMVGNKVDCASKRTVPKDTAMEFAEENNVARYVEASAKDSTNVEDIFTDLTKELLRTQGHAGRTGKDDENESENEDVVHYRKRHIVPVVDLGDAAGRRKGQCNC